MTNEKSNLKETKFITRFSFKDNIFSSPNGSKMEWKYNYKIVGDRKKLVRDKEINIYDLIQANKPLSLEELVKRFEISGDKDIFNSNSCLYGDFVNIPKDSFEYLNKFKSLEKTFNSLPLEIRNKYGFSFEKFIGGILAGDFKKDKENLKSPSKETKTKEEENRGEDKAKEKKDNE